MSKTKSRWILKDSTQFDTGSATELKLITDAPIEITASRALIAEELENFVFGTPATPQDSSFGEGTLYTDGTLVYRGSSGTVSGGNVYTSGSLDLFNSTSVGQEVYISATFESQSYQHTGIRTYFTDSYTTGDIVFEYWDGSSWSEFNFMTSDYDGLRYPYANKLNRSGSVINIRYSSEVTGINSDWATRTIGTGEGSEPNRYWVRARITSTLNNVPTGVGFALLANSTQISSDGFVEYFGKPRIRKRLPWDFSLQDAMPLYDTQTNIGNYDTFYSKNVGVAKSFNKFPKNRDIAIGFDTILPTDIDTSSPIVVTLAFAQNGTSTSNVVFEVAWCLSNTTNTVFDNPTSAETNPTEQLLSEIIAVPANNAISFVEFKLDIPTAIARRIGGFGDIFALTFVRRASSVNDTCKDDVLVVDMRADYVSWCGGIPA
jgi:hypothetical protein